MKDYVGDTRGGLCREIHVADMSGWMTNVDIVGQTLMSYAVRGDQ